MVFGRITELKSASKLLVIDKIIISKAAIMGPMYGIRFNNEHKNAIMKAFLIPKAKSTML